MTRSMKRSSFYLTIFLILVNIFFIFAFFYYLQHKSLKEITVINQKLATMNSFQVTDFFKDLAKRKGGVYAFSILKSAVIPEGNDLHLIGHAIGDELYKQKGIDGIVDCTQDFRNACSHSIVIGAFVQLGEKALPEIAHACEKAPGKKGAYMICFHGVGHGVLAYNDYDFPKTIAMCKKTGTLKRNYQEFSECIGGAVMEIISGGGHDKIAWARQRAKYLQKDSPLSLCSAENMPEQARTMCYTYITPYLWETVRTDGEPVEAPEFQKAMMLCNSIPEESYRLTCFGGFGKEFVGYARNYDTRDTVPTTLSQLKEIHDLCALAPTTAGQQSCLTDVVGGLLWDGQVNYLDGLKFCNLYTGSLQKACMSSFFSRVANNSFDKQYYKSVCNTAPKEYKAMCTEYLQI